MIVVKLMGGMGNQMFQYAFGRFLSLRNKTDLFLDLTYLKDRTPRKNFVFRDYDLDVFNIEIKEIDRQTIERVFSSRQTSKGLLKLLNFKSKRPNTISLEEKAFSYQNNYNLDSTNIYLDGYWQSPKYFESIEHVIRKDFTFKNSMDSKQLEMANKIKSVNSVCINFRRTDFINVKDANDFHGVTPLEYYQKAIIKIQGGVSNPELFVFSDDIEWCRQYFNADIPTTYVDYTYKGPKFDIYLNLMTLCNHFIIPNSTFAWWGAWLSENPDKIVIAPKQWFANEEMNAQTGDLIPKDWIRM
jgi:hypothetical protein